MTQFRILYNVGLAFAMALAFATTSYAADPLSTIFLNLPGASDEAAVWTHADANGPKYSSTAVEVKVYEGFVYPTDDVQLWAFSDDGVNVQVKEGEMPGPTDTKQLNLKGTAQHLPTQGESLHEVGSSFTLEAGKCYGVRVEYENLVYNGPMDSDGCTLYAIDGEAVTVEIDLDVMKISHNAANGELAEDDEVNPGAFVPINNDDDDYDATNTADKDQAGAITGETDLLPIKLHKVEPAVAGSKYLLDIPAHVKVWQNDDRSGAVTGATEFDANADKMLYVEGVTFASGHIKIKWKNGATTFNVCEEKVTVNVFQWEGPLNVPGYSIHRYLASGAPAGSKWIAPGDGTIETGENTSDVTILWDEGPVVGEAIYQVNSDYVWDLEVNVVKITIEDPDATDTFLGGTPSFAGYINFGEYGPVISSGAPGVGIHWYAKVTWEGPTRAGVVHRGVTKIEVGFVQNVTFTTATGHYTVIGAVQLDANLMGNSYLDTTNPGSVYYSALPLRVYKPATTAANDRTETLEGTDTPTAGVPRYFKKGAAPNPPGDDELDRMEWLQEFTLYVTARTDETVLDADDIYTVRAKARWDFDIDENHPFAAPLVNSVVTLPAGDVWTSVTDGSQPTLRDPTATTGGQAVANIAY